MPSMPLPTIKSSSSMGRWSSATRSITRRPPKTRMRRTWRSLGTKDWPPSTWRTGRRLRGTRSPILAEGWRGERGWGRVLVLGRIYIVMYTDGRGQAQTERGRLVALDQEGFVVLEVNGKHVLIPKAHVDALVE